MQKEYAKIATDKIGIKNEYLQYGSKDLNASFIFNIYGSGLDETFERESCSSICLRATEP